MKPGSITCMPAIIPPGLDTSSRTRIWHAKQQRWRLTGPWILTRAVGLSKKPCGGAMRLRAGRADAANLRVLVFPRVGAAKKLRVKSVLLDGEAVIYREDGAADFDKLH